MDTMLGLLPSSLTSLDVSVVPTLRHRHSDPDILILIDSIPTRFPSLSSLTLGCLDVNEDARKTISDILPA